MKPDWLKKRKQSLVTKMRYRDTSHRKNTDIWHAHHCDGCAFKNGWLQGRSKVNGSRRYGQCWLCGKMDFLNRGVLLERPKSFIRRRRN